jgi:hypothetical protein
VKHPNGNNYCVSQKRVIRIFGPMKEEVTRGQIILHNEILSNLYSSPNIIRVMAPVMMRWTVYVACIEELRNS